MKAGPFEAAGGLVKVDPDWRQKSRTMPTRLQEEVQERRAAEERIKSFVATIR